jgi:hypothetical protein
VSAARADRSGAGASLRRVTPVLVLLCSSWVQPVSAQAPDGGGNGWWQQWSPLAPVADLVRRPAPVPTFPFVVLAPAPRVGLAWTAGNPAALARDAADAHTEFRSAARGESGAYRRPLDAGRTNSFLASAAGWRPLGATGGVVGGVTVERAVLSDGAFAGVGEPYAMTPHAFADSSGTDLGRTLARLEGAGGWRLGNWGLGLALGHQSWDTRTGVTQIPRSQRGSRSGGSLGLTRDVAPGLATVGVHARWLSEVQHLSVSTRAAETTVFLFEGYGEPVLTRLGARQGYTRRVERDGGAAVVSAQVRAAGVRWVAFGEASKLDERQFGQLFSNDPPTDQWVTRGHRAGIAAEAGAAGRGTHVVAILRWASVAGDATRAGLEEEGTLFEADESVVDGALDLRFDPGNGWDAGVQVSVAREDRDRIDRLARIRSSVQAWRPGIAVEAARALNDQITLGAGTGLAWYTPSGGIPDPSHLREGYRTWIGPEFAYVATPSRTLAALVTLQWRSPGGQAVSLEAGHDHTTARESATVFQFTPTGSRTAWNIALRWVW